MQKRPETLGEIIKTARDKSDLTVEELTARVGISERYLYRIENEGKVPTFEVLKKIVRELAIDGNLIFYPEKPVKDSYALQLRRPFSENHQSNRQSSIGEPNRKGIKIEPITILLTVGERVIGSAS